MRRWRILIPAQRWRDNKQNRQCRKGVLVLLWKVSFVFVCSGFGCTWRDERYSQCYATIPIIVFVLLCTCSRSSFGSSSNRSIRPSIEHHFRRTTACRFVSKQALSNRTHSQKQALNPTPISSGVAQKLSIQAPSTECSSSCSLLFLQYFEQHNFLVDFVTIFVDFSRLFLDYLELFLCCGCCKQLCQGVPCCAVSLRKISFE